MKQSIDYACFLNPSQLEAVMTLDGPVLVVAGAGSGKTRTLVYRVARLVDIGIAPESILLLTFTRKAAMEMLERAAGLADPRCRFVSGGTFHALAYRVLRQYGERLGFPPGFTILDRSDMEEVLRSLIPDLNLPKGSTRFPKRATLANILSKAANLEQTVDAFMEEEYGQFLEFIPEIRRLTNLYARYKQEHALMDYDDLLINLRKLLADDPEARQTLGRQYSHVMVDEYQDTNAIQADTVSWLAHEHHNVMVVGDDSQSIYSFRGADYRNMFAFPKRFPGARIIKLEENYRSTQPILNLTNAVMAQAGEHYTKCLFTRREGGEKPAVIDTRTEPEQALTVCRLIRQEMDAGRSPEDIAVLFRAAYHSFELEAELTRQRLPYVKYGGFKFLESAHIKDFLAHLRVQVNPEEAVSWSRILCMVKNIGQGKSRSIFEWIKTNRIKPEKLSEWPGMKRRELGLKPLCDLMQQLSSDTLSPRKAVETALDYYTPFLKERYDDYPRRLKELQQLITMAERYQSLRSFLADLVLDPPNSSLDTEPERDHGSLTLSTVHSAKGLEWPVVIVIWVMEGRFPSARAYRNPMELEEERRLMYVAATRAKDRLFFCYPGQEYQQTWDTMGGGPTYQSGLSSFISALPQEIVVYESARTSGRFNPFSKPHDNLSEPAAASLHPFQSGDRVRHPAFGPGVVSRFLDEDKVEVFFSQAGRKLLHLGYTTLEKM